MQGHTVNYKTTKGKETRLISTQKTMFSDFLALKHFLTRYLEDIEIKRQQRDLDATRQNMLMVWIKRHWR